MTKNTSVILMLNAKHCDKIVTSQLPIFRGATHGRLFNGFLKFCRCGFRLISSIRLCVTHYIAIPGAAYNDITRLQKFKQKIPDISWDSPYILIWGKPAQQKMNSEHSLETAGSRRHIRADLKLQHGSTLELSTSSFHSAQIRPLLLRHYANQAYEHGNQT